MALLCSAPSDQSARDINLTRDKSATQIDMIFRFRKIAKSCSQLFVMICALHSVESVICTLKSAKGVPLQLCTQGWLCTALPVLAKKHAQKVTLLHNVLLALIPGVSSQRLEAPGISTNSAQIK